MPSNSSVIQSDKDSWPEILEAVKLYSWEYLQDLASKGTTIQSSFAQSMTGKDLPAAPGMQVGLPETGIGALAALTTFKERIAPLFVASPGPRYLGFVTGGVTPAALAGDWLTSVADQNAQAINGQGDISGLLEVQTIDLLRELLQLPADFIGGFVTGATMANFTCLATARQWCGKQSGQDIAEEGISCQLPVLSGVPHSSAVKSLAMLGIGRNQLLQVPLMEGRESMDMAALEWSIKALKGQPFILVTSAGTVNSVDFDNFKAIAELKDTYDFWWHIDAAFGGFAACSPKYRHLVAGWELADSITLDGHKWLNVPYDAGMFFIHKKHQLCQYETFRNTNAPYLGEEEAGVLPENFNYLNYLPENSRRLRALPAWFTLMAYGKAGYQQIVENSVTLAGDLSIWLEQQPEFRLLAPTRLNNICFALSDQKLNPLVLQWLRRINAGQQVFMSPTVMNGQPGIRLSFVNWRTNQDDLALIKKELRRSYDDWKNEG